MAVSVSWMTLATPLPSGPVRVAGAAGSVRPDRAGVPGHGGPRGPSRPGGPARPGRAQLLEDKLRVPTPSFPVLDRPRVSALLDRAGRHRVTVISGPAGAGKTVACASWSAAGPAAGRVVWLTVDADDQRDWFWAYICMGLSRVRPAPQKVPRDRVQVCLFGVEQLRTHQGPQR